MSAVAVQSSTSSRWQNLSDYKDVMQLKDKIIASKIPRNFVLLNEVSLAKDYSYVPYGVKDQDKDIMMKNWTGTMVHNNGDITFFEFECDDDFPTSAPRRLRFVVPIENTRVKRVCDEEGYVKKEYIAELRWKEDMKLGDYLMKLREYVK